MNNILQTETFQEIIQEYIYISQTVLESPGEIERFREHGGRDETEILMWHLEWQPEKLLGPAPQGISGRTHLPGL